MAATGTGRDQTELWEHIRRTYAPAEPTNPSAQRPQYVEHDSISTARDLGEQDNLLVNIRGAIGGQTGTSTLYFKAALTTHARLGIRLIGATPQELRWLSVGLLDGNHRQIPINAAGFGIPPRRAYGDPGEEEPGLPPGTYYFTLTTSQWTATPFELQLAVIAYTAIGGPIQLNLANEGRLAMARPEGVQLLELQFDSSIPAAPQLKLMDGLMDPTLTGDESYLAKRSGTALFNLQMGGRFSTFFYIQGTKQDTLVGQGDLTVTRTGYGY